MHLPEFMIVWKPIKKVSDFIQNPHFPYFMLLSLQKISPRVARLIKYGRNNPNTSDYWNKIFDGVEYSRIEDERYGLLRQEILRFIPPNSKVLDVGCGTGRFMEIMAQQKACECAGLDVSEVSIGLVRRKGFEGFLCDLPSLPSELQDRRFDVCVLIETLEHLSRPERTLKRVTELLMPNGWLIISVPEGCMKPEEFDEHIWAFDRESLAALMPSSISIESFTSCECAGYKYLIMIGKCGSARIGLGL